MNSLEDVASSMKRYALPTDLVYSGRSIRQVRDGIRAGAKACLMDLKSIRALNEDPMSRAPVEYMHTQWKTRYGDINSTRPVR